jgi:Carboxypeptidase regulatory-like domain/TonB dependent receptor
LNRSYAAALQVVTALAISLIIDPVAPAQVLYGSLVGNVTDSKDAAVPGAAVVLRNRATALVRRAASNDRGQYSFNDLPMGDYDATVSASGFADAGRNGIAIAVNTVRRLDVQLSLSTVEQSVEVSGSAEALQTDRSDVGASIGARQITDLPIGGQRNYQSLELLVPGVTPPRAQNSQAGNPQGSLVTNVNGTSYSVNANRLDGASNVFIALPHHAAYIPPAESIETVNIVTSSFDAEQGMAGGSAVNVITRSGTNAFHGTAFEYNTNSALRARNFFYLGARIPKNIQNQFGYALGGPLRRNKLFFFTDYEGTRQRTNSSSLNTVATDALRGGNFAGTGTVIYNPFTGNPDGTGRTPFADGIIPPSMIATASAKMIALLPEPNQGGFANNYFSSGTVQFNRDNFDGKVNYNPNEKYVLFARYSIFNFNLFDPPLLGAGGGTGIDGSPQPGNAGGRTQSATLGGTVLFSSRFLLDAHLGFTRQETHAANLDIGTDAGLNLLNIPGTNGPDPLDGGFPAFVVNGYASFGNPNAANPYDWRDQQYVSGFNFTLNRSSHNFRWGGELLRWQLNEWQPNFGFGARGGFNFTGGLTALNGGAAPNQFSAWADFLLGLAQNMGKAYEPAVMTVRTWMFALYARDQWQVTRNLTINYGLRWEKYPYSTRAHRGLERYDPTTNLVLVGGVGNVPTDTGVDTGIGQFAPRLGLAYRLGTRTVLRAGYGISIDPYSFTVVLRGNYPAITNSQYTGANGFTAAGSLVTGIPPVSDVSLGNGIIPIPGTVADTLVDPDFRRGYVESMNLTVEREIHPGYTASAAYVGSRGIRQMVMMNINAAGPGGGNAGRPLAVLFGRTADTNDLVPFRTANYNSLQTQLQRAPVRGVSFGAVYTYSKTIAFNDNSDSTLAYNWIGALQLNRSLTGYDRTNNLELYGNAELPFGKGRPLASSGIAAAIAGGWQLNGIFSAYSGTPFTVTASSASLNAPGNTQTADQVLPTVAIPGGVGTNATWFDPAAFAPVTTARFGTSGLNVLRGPGAVSLNLSLFRDFSVRERVKIQFRAEAFNLSNTPIFNNPNASVSSATFNSNGTIKALNGFAQITSAQPAERQIRLGVRLSF